MKLLHLANERANPRLFTARFRRELSARDEFCLIENVAELEEAQRISLIQDTDILLTGWGSVTVPKAVSHNPGRLKYICHLTGSIREIVPAGILGSRVLITNWGDAPAFSVAEGALALLLALLKQFPRHILDKRAGAWKPLHEEWIGSMRNLRIGIYGYGHVGRAFHDLCRPFQTLRTTVFDPFARELPSDANPVASLSDLFSQSDAIAIHAALTENTRSTVTAPMLQALPDGGIIVNTARGDILDQGALFAELAAGRLRAGLDVLAGDDRLPEGHPATAWPNLLLSSHLAHSTSWPPDAERLEAWHLVALENLHRFRAGLPLQFILTPDRLSRST